MQKMFTSERLEELAIKDLEYAIKSFYDLKFDELDPYIEDIIKLNELVITETKKEIENCLTKLFPIKNE